MSWFNLRSWVLYCLYTDSHFLSLERKVFVMSEVVDKLKAAYEENKAVVAKGLDDLKAKLADLKAQLEALPHDTAAQEALAAEIMADTEALRDRLKPDDEPSDGV